MTEQEKLHHAKHYIDSLANGLNPLDGTPIPEQDMRVTLSFEPPSLILGRRAAATA